MLPNRKDVRTHCDRFEYTTNNKEGTAFSPSTLFLPLLPEMNSFISRCVVSVISRKYTTPEPYT